MPRPTSRAVVSALLLLSGLSACPPSTNPDGGVLRPDVVVLDPGQPSQDHCVRFDPVTCTTYYRLKVVDAVQHRGTIYVAAMRDVADAPRISSGLSVFASRDQGATWKRVEVPVPGQVWTGATRLVPWGNHLSVLVQEAEEHFTGWWQYVVDVEAGTAQAGPFRDRELPLPNRFDVVAEQGTYATTWYLLDSVRRTSYDLTTGLNGDVLFLHAPSYLGPAPVYPLDPTATKARAYAVARNDAGVLEACTMTVDQVGQVLRNWCGGDGARFQGQMDALVSEGELWVVTGSEGHTWLSRTDLYAPGKVESWDLGPGDPRFDQGGQVAVVGYAEDRPRLFTLRHGVARAVDVPVSPCSSGCDDIVNGLAQVTGRHATFERVLRLEDGSYLLLGNLETVDRDFRTTWQLMAWRAWDANLPGDRPPPATTLEKQCARLTGCFPPNWANDLFSCTQYWTRLRANTSANDAAWQAFATAGDCAALRLAYPQAVTEEGACSAGACEGPVAFLCQGGQRAGALNCRETGTVCQLDATLGATCTPPPPAECASSNTPQHCSGQRAISCPNLDDCGARGLSCVEAQGSAQCMDSAVECPPGNKGYFCGGSNLYSCASGHALPLTDCARLGLACRNGACVAVEDERPCTTEAPHCVGSVAAWCQSTPDPGMFNRPREVDCASLGLRCQDGACVR